MTSPASAPDALDLGALRAYLDEIGIRVEAPLAAQLISGGKSNLTFAVSDGVSEWIVRRPPVGDVLPGAHDMSREYRIMAALGTSEVPVPAVLGLCADDGRIGAPFFVMDRVPGTVVRTRRDALNLPTGLRERIGTELVDTLVVLHEADYAAVGLANLGRPDGYLERQVSRWCQQYERIRVRELPLVGTLARALAATLPRNPAASLVHGDYRLDNVIVSGDGTIAAVLDWELATLGDPLTDLGTLLMFWDEPGGPVNPITQGLMAVDGFPTRDDVIERYLRQRRVPLDDLDWYLVFAEFKLAVILEQIHARHSRGDTRGDGFDGVGDMVLHLLAAARERAAAARYL